MEPQLYMAAPPFGHMMHPGGWGPPYQPQWSQGMPPPGRAGSNRGPRGGRGGGARGYAFNFAASAKRHNHGGLHGGFKNKKKRRKNTWQQNYATAAQASPAVAADSIQSERRHEQEAEQLLVQPWLNTWGTNHPKRDSPEEDLVDAPWSVRHPSLEQQEDAHPSSTTPSPGAEPTAAPASSTSPPQQQLQEAQVRLQAQGSVIAELQQRNQQLAQALEQAEAHSKQLKQEMLQLRSQLAATGAAQGPQLSMEGEHQAAA